MDINLKVTINGIEDLTQAMGILANAIALGRATTTEYINAGADQVKVIEEKITKKIKETEKQDPDPGDTSWKDHHDAEVAQTDEAPPWETREIEIEIEKAVDDEDQDPEEEALKMEDIRPEIVAISKKSADLKSKVKGIVKSYGVDLLSEVDPKHYAELLERVKAL
jgi:hypothetical protein